MSRIFNIYFTYDDSLRSAIVSVRQSAEQTEYVLGNLDQEIRELLPGTTLVLAADGSLKFKEAPFFDRAVQLESAIAQSLALHLKFTGTSL